MTSSCTGQPGATSNRASAVRSAPPDAAVRQTYLVSVHGQEGLVELDGLELLPHQFVFDTFGVCQFDLFL